MGTHAEQGHQHEGQVIGRKPQRADRHDADLRQLDHTNERVLGKFLPELSTQRRKKKERQDEQQGTQIDPDGSVTVPKAQLEQDGQDQRLLEQVVVERTERLSNEKRQEAPLAEQGELRGMTHRPWSWVKPRGHG